MELLSLLDDFLASRHDLRPKTLLEYGRAVRRFCGAASTTRLLPGRACTANCTLGDLTAQNVSAYVQSCLDRGKRHTANHDGLALCLFSKWLVEAGGAASDPLAGFRVPPQPKTRRQPFPDEALPRIVQAASRGRCGARNSAIVVLALAAGLRLDELHRLRFPEDVDLVGGFVYVRSGKTDAAERCVRLDPLAATTLAAYLSGRTCAGPLFPKKDGDALTYNGFATIFRPIKKRLNGTNFMIHRARNTAITNWLRAGTDLYTVMQLAGHTNPKVTVRYAGKLNEADLTRLVRPGLSSVYSGPNPMSLGVGLASVAVGPASALRTLATGDATRAPFGVIGDPLGTTDIASTPVVAIARGSMRPGLLSASPGASPLLDVAGAVA